LPHDTWQYISGLVQHLKIVFTGVMVVTQYRDSLK